MLYIVHRDKLKEGWKYVGNISISCKMSKFFNPGLSLHKTRSIKLISTVSRINPKPLPGLLDVNHVMSN